MIAFACRVAARLPAIKGGQWGMDDWLIAAAVVSILATFGVIILELTVKQGLYDSTLRFVGRP